MKPVIKIALTATLTLLALCGAALAQEASRPKAAVYIVGDQEGRDVLRMLVNNFLIRSGKYQMIAVDAIDVVAEEQHRQMSGDVSDADIANLGQSAGAEYVCVVEQARHGTGSIISVRMVNVASKIAELSEVAELARNAKVSDVVEGMIGKMLGISPPPETTRKVKPEPTPKSDRSKRVSVGVGGVFASDYGGGARGKDNDYDGIEVYVKMPSSGWGGHIYLDVVYAELFAGIFYASGEWRAATNLITSAPYAAMERTVMNYGAFLKYPKNYGWARIYPLLGIDCELLLSAYYDNYNEPDPIGDGYVGKNDRSDFGGAVWFKGGGGLDIDIGDNMYLRVQTLYGVRTPVKFEEKLVASNPSWTAATTRLGHGLTIRVGAGYAF